MVVICILSQQMQCTNPQGVLFSDSFEVFQTASKLIKPLYVVVFWFCFLFLCVCFCLVVVVVTFIFAIYL